MLLSLLLAAAPVAPAPLPASIPAPLGHFGDVVEPAPKGGMASTDPFFALGWDGCEDVVFPQRFATGASRALEQLQQALDHGAGSEKRLFTGKGVLAEVLHQLTGATLSEKGSCQAPKLVDGWKLPLVVAPKKLCDARAGERWLFAGAKPVAVISVQRPETGCRPRISAVLFDARGQARVRFHADWSAAMAVTLVGDRCRNLDFTFDGAQQAFIPSWSSCKR